MLASPAPCAALAAGGMGRDGTGRDGWRGPGHCGRAKQGPHPVVAMPGAGCAWDRWWGRGSRREPWCWDGAMVPAWSWCGGSAGLVPAAGAGAGAAAAACAQPPPLYPGTGPQKLGRGTQTPPECRWQPCPCGAGGARGLGAARVAPRAGGAWRPWGSSVGLWGGGLCLSSSVFKPFPFASARCFLLLSSKSLLLPRVPSLQHRQPARTPACAHLRATSQTPAPCWVGRGGAQPPAMLPPPPKAAGIGATAAPHRPSGH